MRRRSQAAWVWCWLAACGGAEPPPQPEPLLPADAALKLELVFAVKMSPEEILVGGFSGAASPGEEITIEGFGSATAGMRGRFEVRFQSSAERITASARGESYEFAVRDMETALNDAVHVAEGGAGSVPNDLIALQHDTPRAVLVRSGDDALSLIDPTRGVNDETAGVRLPRGANPWFAAPLGDRVAVTGFGDHNVYVADLARGEVRILTAPAPISLPQPFELSRPVDLDGDGTMESRIDRLVPRAPQAIATEDGAVFAAFSGFVAAGRGADPPVYVPPVIAHWSNTEATPVTFRLPDGVMNPQELRIHDGALLIVATGVFDLRSGTPSVLTPSSVLILEKTGAVRRQIPLPDFVPGSALIVDRTLWISSLSKAEVAWIDLDAPGEPQKIQLGEEPVDSVFRLIALPGDLIAAPVFNSDQLFILDGVERKKSPPPFLRPIRVGPGRPIFDGLQIVTRRPGRAGVDFAGPDLFTLSGVASRIRSIELRKVLGP